MLARFAPGRQSPGKAGWRKALAAPARAYSACCTISPLLLAARAGPALVNACAMPR